MRAITLMAVLFVASRPGVVAAQILPGDVTLDLHLVASGLTSPVTATHAGDGSGRLFVADQAGTIRIIKNGELLPDPFLDLTGEIVTVNSFFDERGLLGAAFHPNYRSNGRLFVRYSKPREGSADEPCFGTTRGCHEEVLAEYRVSNDDPDRADPDGTILFRIDEPQFNHDAGHVAFGSDGYLYFTLGDGGGANDGLADDPPSHGPIGNGQNTETALGSILRIDVDAAPQPPRAYAVPVDNPFVARDGLDEIYAYGLRNPYRFSFDRGADDDEGDDEGDDEDGDETLFLADVGQNRLEEIDVIVKGGNYGWVIREGSTCFDPFNPLDPPADCPSQGASGEPLIDPLAEYDHAEGIAVVGGFVYRGARFSELVGKYVFGDFSRNFVPGNGRLFYLDLEGDPSWIFEFRLGPDDPDLNKYVLGFGQDERGELYLLTSGNLGPSGNTGEVFHIGVARDNDDEGDDEGYDPEPPSGVDAPFGDPGHVDLGDDAPDAGVSNFFMWGEELERKTPDNDRRSGRRRSRGIPIRDGAIQSHE